MRTQRLRRTHSTNIDQEPKFKALMKDFNEKWDKLNFDKISEVVHLDDNKDFLYR